MKTLMKALVVSLFVAGTVTVSAENLLKDTGFSKDSGWNFWVDDPFKAAGGSVTLEDGKAVAKSPAIEKQETMDAGIQLIKPIDVEAGKNYRLKFKADAGKAGTLTVAYCLSKPPFTSYAVAYIELKPGQTEYECTLAVKKDKDGKYDAPRSLRLFAGAFKDATVVFSDLCFEEVK